MKPSPTRATILVLVLFVTGVLGGAFVGAWAADRARDPYRALDTFVRVVALVERAWVDEVAADDLVERALREMVDDLDPHSTWLDADTWQDLQRETHGAYTGIGVDVRWREVGAVVSRVIPGSPAEKAGLTLGDVLLSVDGEALTAEALHREVAPVLGPRGSEAVIAVRSPEGDVREVTVVRDVVTPVAVRAEVLPDGVVVARIVQFREGAAADLRAALARASDTTRITGVVLDLRDNPGGLLREAVATVDLFVEDGVVVSTWGRLEAERHAYEATAGAESAPVAVITNGLTASAAEIVTAALQERDRATVVGTRTYGKGTVQTVFEHRDGSALKLTIARYLTPSGEPVAPRRGRAPDVVVPWPGDVTPADALAERIADLDVPEDERLALLELVDQLPPTELRRTRTDIPWALDLADRLDADPQLAAAVDAVRGG